MYSQSLRNTINDDDKKQDLIDLSSADWADKKYQHGDDAYTQWELSCAFNLVADKEHWKNPIDATIPDEDVKITSYAIMHIAGCAASITPLGDGNSQIKAVGYFNAVGA